MPQSAKRANPSATADPEHLLTVATVCQKLGINEHTFYSYRKRYPSFKTVKVGNRTYMRPERLDAFLRELEELQA